MIGAINTLAIVLAVRWTVMMAVAGGILLASQAIGAPDLYKLGMLAIYGLVVVVPVVWLAATGRG